MTLKVVNYILDLGSLSSLLYVKADVLDRIF